MWRYDDPRLQGLFVHKYMENGFGFVQPREDLKDSIIPPDFQQLPALVTEVLQTLAREDLTFKSPLDVSTDTEATTHVQKLCMQPDPEVLRQTVLNILVEGGHSHLIPPELKEYSSDKGSAVNNIDTLPMSPTRRIVIEAAQRMWPETPGPTAEELLHPTSASPATPQQSAASPSTKPSPTQQISGRQMDASHNQRAHAKRTSSPTTQDPNKHAKSPTRETEEPVRHSRGTHRHHG